MDASALMASLIVLGALNLAASVVGLFVAWRMSVTWAGLLAALRARNSRGA